MGHLLRVIPNVSMHQSYQEGSIQLPSRVSDATGRVWWPRFCISLKFPDDAEAASLEPMLWEPLLSRRRACIFVEERTGSTFPWESQGLLLESYKPWDFFFSPLHEGWILEKWESCVWENISSLWKYLYFTSGSQICT